MNKLLGFIVTRSLARNPNPNTPVWCGFTEEERVSHKQFILDKVACPAYDGVTSFDYVQDNIVIEVGQWWETENGNFVNIQDVKGISFRGYCFKTKNIPKNIPDNVKVVLGYVNGECLNGWKLIRKCD